MHIGPSSLPVAAQASSQFSAIASLQLLRKTLELQAAGAAAVPTPPANSPAHLGTRIDLQV
ncbi:putative motility protein [Pseudomonas sp. HMWF032]|nr:putative motility protein [Pseudomonas sp. HMWF032]PTT86327.1 putative motility protein [Pseudomonas sp. HMWF010]